MADAAKSARGAFSEIQSGSNEMGGHVGTNMFAARHSVMALSEAFGTQMPRAITAFIAHLGPMGPALEAAFPFAAIGLGAVLLIEHLGKMREAGIALTEDQVRFGTAAQNAFNAIDQKMLQAQIRSDELRNDHLGALRLQLQLINMQSMDELVHSFGILAKVADVVFAGLKSSWYQFGIGSSGAKNALDEFQAKYEALLAKQKDGEAHDLLKGTLESAQHIRDMQKQAQSTGQNTDPGGHTRSAASLANSAAWNELRKAGVGITDKETKAQQQLVDALNDQMVIEQRIAGLKKQDGDNAKLSDAKEIAALRAEGARQAAEHSQKMGEIALSIQKEQAAASLSIAEASVAERLASDMKLADAEYRVQMEGNQKLIAALDTGGKDYNNQLRGLQDKAEEMTAQHAATLANLQSKAQEEQYREDLQNLEQSEREKIDATEQGSAARLAAIDAALKEEQAKNLQTTSFYRELMQQRVEVERQADAEEAKLASEAGKEQAANAQKMAELGLAAAQEHQALMDSSRRVTVQQQIAEETKAANDEYAIKLKAMQQEAAALDKGAKDYTNKLKEMQDQERQLTQEHENQITQIKDKAEMERNQKILSAEQRFNDTITAGLTQVLMHHKTFASMMTSLGNEVVAGAMQNAIKSMEANLVGKQSDAEKAARKAYLLGQSEGGPAGMVLGPVFAAVAFSTMMGFQDGTDMVPGIGTGDKVPAMLEPGEGVVPGGVMDGLRNMARNGGLNQSPTTHYSPKFAPVVHAMDAEGVDRVLTKHQDIFHAHAERAIRKLNK
jgi:hypothetical protein